MAALPASSSVAGGNKVVRTVVRLGRWSAGVWREIGENRVVKKVSLTGVVM